MSDLSVTTAVAVVQPEEDRTAQVGIGAGHLREIAIVAYHDPTGVTSEVKRGEPIATLVEARLIAQALRVPPQMRLAIVGDDAVRRHHRCRYVQVVPVTFGQSVDDQGLSPLQKLREGLSRRAVQRLREGARVIDVAYKKFLVEQHDVSALHQRFLRMGQGLVPVGPDLPRIAVLLNNRQSDRHLCHIPFRVLSPGASALPALG